MRENATSRGPRVLSRLFISHSSGNDDWAIALKDWLIREGWSGKRDIFLDLDPERGIAAGQRWVRELEDAATRCEAVLFLVSRHWLASRWCNDEYQLANKLNKKLFALLIDDIALDRLPGGLTAQWQIVRLIGEPGERFLTVHPHTRAQVPVHISEAGLTSLKRGLEKAGIGSESFELQPDANGPFGWRAPYRGLEALEPEDAAVFFGRGADIVRGIDALRGLAARKQPRLLVILGASGAGKSSFLRAGLWPRLLRDDSQWLPLKAIRAGRGGAIEGGEGLLAALEDVHRRFGIRASRADLRDRAATPQLFVALLAEMRQAAARRALISEPPDPLPVLCLDQGEEVFAADAAPESDRFLELVRAAIEEDAALLLVTIRSDSYGRMQGEKSLAGIDQVPLSLGPVAQGEIGHVIRGPAEILRRKAGPSAPAFDAAVVARLQAEIEGEADALPLLAFVMQRLTREHAGAATIGLDELERTGGVAAAIESAAEAALADAGFGPWRAERRDALRHLFIPRLARIDRENKMPQRRIARQSDLPADLLPLARALTQRRLLVVKLAARPEGVPTGDATLEVAHEALLRRWPTLVDLLAEDRDALLLLDGVLSAAADWDKAEATRKPDYLAHRGSRLTDAQALAARGPEWAHEIVPAGVYLAACQAREAAEHAEKEAALAREQARLAEITAAQYQIKLEQGRTERQQQRAKWMLAAIAGVVVLGIFGGIWQYQGNLARQAQLDRAQADLITEQAESNRRKAQLDRGRVNLIAEFSATERLRGNMDSALRLAVHAFRRSLELGDHSDKASVAAAELSATVSQSDWRLMLSGHDRALDSAAFSPDGTRIVTLDGYARFWDAATGKEIGNPLGRDNWVRFVVFSPDGKRIATAWKDNTARIWDAETGKEIALLRGHEDGVLCASFSPDGSRLVTGSFDKTTRIWDTATAQEIAVLRGNEGWVDSVAFSPDGTRIADTRGRAVRILDAQTGKELARFGVSSVAQSVAFSPDGARVVMAFSDKTARIWDAATAKEVVVLGGHREEVHSAAFSPDGSRVVTASWDKTARIWDAATGRELVVLRGHTLSLGSAAFSPDGKRVVTAAYDHTARIWDATTRQEIAVLSEHKDSVQSATFSPNGSHIVTGSYDGTARVWDAETGKEVAVLLGHEHGVVCAAFSPDGSHIVTASVDKTARVWDASTAQEITVLRGHEGPVNSVAFSPDGYRIVTGSGDGSTTSKDNTARIWDATSGKEIATLQHERQVTHAAFSPDGSRIVTASGDRAHIWDANTSKEIAVLHHPSVRSATFSPDGKRIVTASWDETARIWDASTAQEITVMRGHEKFVQFAGFSADGSRIVTASHDQTARVWDANTGREIAVVRGHGDSLNFAAFSPNGTRVVTASDDATARIWDVHVAMMSANELVTEACTRRLLGLTTLTRNEMRLAGYADDVVPIDVCAGIGRVLP